MFVVAGVSGNTGSVVAHTLLDRKAPVRVVVRDAEKGAPFRARGAEVAVADLGDAAALTQALRGAEGAYLLVPPNVTAEDVLGAQGKVLDAFVDAVRASRVPHVVFLSSIGAQLPAGTGPIQLVHRAEKALSEVLQNVTFVRAAYFMENLGGGLAALPGGVFPSFLRADARIAMIATKDIGRVAAEALLRGPRGRDVIELEGPERYAPTDVAAALASITGKPVRLEVAPEDAIIGAFQGFGFSRDMASLYDEMIRALNAGKIGFEGGAAKATKGEITLREALAGMLG